MPAVTAQALNLIHTLSKHLDSYYIIGYDTGLGYLGPLAQLVRAADS